MTATDELRRMLDERGVEYEVDDAKTVRVTRWRAYGDWVSFIEYDNGDTKFCIDARRLTPEQAIAATLGREDTYTREDVESAFASGYSLGSLPVGSDPQWDENRQTVDEHMAELGWVRKTTLGSSNCTNDCTNSERTGTCLPHFWTHDGTLHVEATRMPTRIVVCEGGTCEFVPKRELDASEAENAKLRELVDGWDFCSKTKSSTFDNCVGCPLFIQTPHSYWCARDERMRELGIEVGE
jgi:hypothetical protein